MILPLLNCLGNWKGFKDIHWFTVQRRVYESAKSVYSSDFPGLVKSTLNMIDASKDRKLNEGWLSVLRKLLGTVPSTDSATVYFVIRVAMERSPHLCDEMVDIFFQMHRSSLRFNSSASWSDVMLVMLAAKSHGAKDSLVATLISCQRCNVQKAWKGARCENFLAAAMLANYYRNVGNHSRKLPPALSAKTTTCTWWNSLVML